MSLYEYVYVGAVHKSFQLNFTFSLKGQTSGLAQSQFQPLDFYIFENFDLLSQAPGVSCLTHLSLASIVWDVANSADPDQTPQNHGGVGSG